MDGNMLKEISYLTRLIEQHKRVGGNLSSFAKQGDKKFHYPPLHSYQMAERQNGGDYNCSKNFLPPGRVHVNPNFKPKVLSSGIHVNPRVAAKPSVHVNPKMMKNFSAQSRDNKKLPDFDKVEKNSSRRELVERKIEPSVHVNPKLMKELSSAREKLKNVEKQAADKLAKDSKPLPLKSDNFSLIQSKTKIVKNNSSSLNSGEKKIQNSNFVSLSRRKLVRIRRSSRNGPAISPVASGRSRRSSSSNIRKTKVSTKYKLVMECVAGSTTIPSLPRSLRTRQSGLSKYKIDRTHIQKVAKRLSVGKNCPNNLANKNASGSTTGLVRIGGILYKSSRNRLVRSSNDDQPSKRKRCIINFKGDRFVMASNGKKLRRLNSARNGSGNFKSHSLVSRIDIGGMTFVEKTPNVLVRAHTRNNISTKAKQRSIQILRNKMRKNNQPCLIFQKFGYCTGQVKGTCPKLHDKKQVALCRNFLQGKCLLDNCTMSHSVCPEKMPTCKYFLEGCCIRDKCPYLHVKVSSNTPICAQFLRGYCAEANKCKQRHVYLCPEYERTGNCAKGKYCPYPHKQSTSGDNKKSIKVVDGRKLFNKKKSSSNKPERIEAQSEDRKRYYDEAGSSKDELEKKRKTILNSIKIMKGVKLAESQKNNVESSIRINDDNNKTNFDNDHCKNEDKSDEEDACPKRTPLGPLPAYIPID